MATNPDGSAPFGTLLRQLRLRAGLSQEALAERARLSIEAVSALERGARRAPQHQTLALLADALRVMPADRAQLEASATGARLAAGQSRMRRARRGVEGAPANEAEARQRLPHNLPATLTSFIGRERELGEIAELVAQHRLVTLVGPGGVGKTRTALRVGESSLDGFTDGVWAVELASLADGALVPSTIASALGMILPGQGDLLAGLVIALKRRRLLLLLDNCEHLIDATARVAEALLRGCPQLSILATSRQALGMGGEAIFPIPPLAVPDEARAATLTVTTAIRYDAIALFAERAGAVSRFTLADATVATVIDVCRRLDGIPLAIELAAPRLKTLSVEELDRQLDDRFQILTGGNRTALPRQQTLRALIDWSHDLLSPEERMLFRRLAVFVGGWSLEAVMAICADEHIAAWEVVELLQSLVEKSLVIAEIGDTDQRYRLLESTRDYALEKLQEYGEHERIARRHAEWFLEVMRRAEEDWGNITLADWRARYEPERDNFRVALEWALEGCRDRVMAAPDPDRAIQYAEWAGDLALMRSAQLQAVEHFSDALEALGALPVTTAREQRELVLRTKLGPALMMARGYGAIDVETNYHRALELAESFGDLVAQFKSLWGLWRIATEHAHGAIALGYSEQLVALADRLDDKQFRLGAPHARWANMKHGASLSDTIANAEEGLRLYDPQRHYAHVYIYGGHDPAVCAHAFIGIALALMGRYTRAREKAREAIAVGASLTHSFSLVHGLLLGGIAYQLADDVDACAEVAATLINAAGEAGVSIGLAIGWLLEGWCYVTRGDTESGIAHETRDRPDQSASQRRVPTSRSRFARSLVAGRW